LCTTGQESQLLLSTFVTLLTNFGGWTRQYQNLPSFWRFMYWALPSHYAVEGMVSRAGLAPHRSQNRQDVYSHH
jgi:ABC-type multidrug transport system permease subunit